MKKRLTTKRPPTGADYEKDAFLQGVKHLSTQELDYRMTENLRAQVLAENGIAEHEAKLKALRMDASRLRREQATVAGLVDARRRLTAFVGTSLE